MKLHLGLSPCPNDTFIFYALLHAKIDLGGLHFEPQFADVELLNKQMSNGLTAVSKVSVSALRQFSERVEILEAGAALGFGNGPLLVSRRKYTPKEIPTLRIAIPGVNTTANLVLSMAFSEAKDKYEYLFSDIEKAVLNDEVDAGLIIHESRFTYASKGLKKIIDLGEWWETETKLPLPLGVIVVDRSLPANVKQTIDRAIADSVKYAFEHPEETYPFVKKYAQEMADEVIKQHIGLYVNEFTKALGSEGKNAIIRFFERATLSGVCQPPEIRFIQR